MKTTTSSFLTCAMIVSAALCGIAIAQPAPPESSVQATADSDVEVLTRGPLHEAFGSPISHDPVQNPVVEKQPPEPIDELPPEHRPDGDNVVWIPGYWDWEGGRDDFIWISGLWRNAPPGRRWVPGYWNEVSEGWRWVPGAWMQADVQAMTYYDRPPESQERGPNSRAPSNNHFWVPGSWVRDQGRYKWRTGYWAPHQPGWVWVAAHYTPAAHGYVYHEGYWDYRVSQRGQLFAPVHFRGRTRARFTPSIALTTSANLLLHLFVDPHSRYVFGDYYGDRYQRAGYHPWYEYHRGAGGYDPFYVYYDWDYGQRGVDYFDRLQGWHKYFLRHADARPPVTWTAQVAFAAAQQGDAALEVALLGTPLNDLLSSDAGSGFVQVRADQRTSFSAAARQMLDLAGRRSVVESATRVVSDAEVRLPTEPLELPELPGVRVPEVGRDVPDLPRNLRTLPDAVPRNVPVPRLPVEPSLPSLPGLPF